MSSSTADLKPLVLYGRIGPSPNPLKTAIFLEELGVPWTLKAINPDTELKTEPYISLNPNGRLPALEDPNTGVKVWESGAIFEYLVATYDGEHKFHSADVKTQWLEKSWLFFQVSGQGPYFGQKFWFDNLHHEQIESAKLRYGNEIKRVTGVIDAHLKKQGTQYLTGDSISYADISFIAWQTFYPALMPGWDFAADAPAFAAWNERLVGRPAVKDILGRKEFQMPSRA